MNWEMAYYLVLTMRCVSLSHDALGRKEGEVGRKNFDPCACTYACVNPVFTVK